ncbi:MAG: hypothetical protein LLG01_15725 [Planctomycetaceae bacterium]|nr:hypothetical protein [Planctomycetaceae bacterium]
MAAEREEVTFTREEFYQKLWEIPSRKLAKQLGCSDVLLGRIARSLRVPKPYVGYWSRLASGKNPRKTALRPCADPDVQSITFYLYPKKKPPEIVAPPPPPEPLDADILDLLDKARNLPPIQLASCLQDTLPVVQDTATYLEWLDKNRTVDFLGEYIPPYDGPPYLDVVVSKKCRQRALLIFDAFAKAVEALGGKVLVRKDGKAFMDTALVTEVSLAGRDSRFRLREKQDMVLKRPPKKGEIQNHKCDRVWTGLLGFDRGSGTWASGPAHDTPQKRKLEDCLLPMLIDMIESEGRYRIFRREWEAGAEQREKQREEQERLDRQRREELHRKRQSLMMKQVYERQRVEKLMADAANWRRSQDIRDYVEALEQYALQKDGAIAPGSEQAEYIAWARQQADRLDPRMPSPPSVLDETLPEVISPPGTLRP